MQSNNYTSTQCEYRFTPSCMEDHTIIHVYGSNYHAARRAFYRWDARPHRMRLVDSGVRPVHIIAAADSATRACGALAYVHSPRNITRACLAFDWH